MRKRILAILITLTSLLFFVNSSLPVDDSEGRMLLYVRQTGDSFVIESMEVESCAMPFPESAGSATFTYRDDGGRIVASGKAMVRNMLFHDHSTGQGGELEGYSEQLTESFVVSVPYHRFAPLINVSFDQVPGEVRGDLRRIPRMRDSLPKDIEEDSSYRPQYRDYLQSMFPNGEHLLPEELREFGADVSAGAAATAHIRVNVNKTPKGVDGFIQLWFYKENGKGEWDSSGYKSVEGFGKTHTLKLAPGFYRAHVLANAYIPGGYGAYVRIGARMQNLFFRTGKTTASKPATLSINYNYLTTVRVVNEKGKLVSARINVVDHVKKSKAMWSTLAANTIASDFTPREVQFRLTKGAKVFVVYPWDTERYGEMIQVEKIKRNDDNEVTIVLPSLDTVKGNALKRIWPGASGDVSAGAASGKMNILFMAEAYTNGHESFTDKNGNGVWDGDLLLDDNGNGKCDLAGNNESYIDRNKNGKYDAPEPFKDTNGDGICNRYERAKFEFQCALAATALLNTRPFDKYSDRIQIYTYWLPSKHGVQKLIESKPWKNMNTAFGVYCVGTGCFRSARIDNSSIIYNRAKQALPGYTVPVVMVQDPFAVLRSNAAFNFGRVLLSAADSRSGFVLIHELGHSIGNLDDEYIVFGGTYTGVEPWAVNLTKETNQAKVKWKRLIKGTIPVPTPQDYNGYGLFEGGALGDKGVYRPTPNSMMRETEYPFYKVNEAQLVKVLKSFSK